MSDDATHDFPPTEPEFDLLDATPPDTKWPKVIGIISLIYAIGGLLCQIGYGLSTFVLADLFMGMGGIEVEMPVRLKLLAAVSAVISSALAVILLIGAINLLRRRRAGVTMHKFWVIARLLWLLISVVVGVVMMPASVAYQRDMNDAINRMLAERGEPAREFDEDRVWRMGVIQLAAFSGVLAIYPLFIGFYLSRRRIADEVSQWE